MPLFFKQAAAQQAPLVPNNRVIVRVWYPKVEGRETKGLKAGKDAKGK